MPEAFPEARALLTGGVRDGAFPAAVVETGSTAGVAWRAAFGALSYEADAPAAHEDTIFDLASLTKVLATTTVAMRLVEDGCVGLSDRITDHAPAWRGQDRAHVTVRDLLEHCGGLTAWLPFYRDHEDLSGVVTAICKLPLEYAPWTRSVYSDLGFMLLGSILERAGGARLEVLAAPMFADVEIRFRPPPGWLTRTAPTEQDPWRGRLLRGEVHDENAWAIGGVAGHAGLFGSAPAVGSIARTILETLRHDTALGRPDTLRRFLTRSTVPGSSRALGWDTMLPTSSCGSMMSPAAFGHTGFAGTSLWIDPERDLYVVLLTNRVHPTRDNDRLRRLRPLIHDAIVRAHG